ncbi:hypothetical protein Nepgr_021093 [Nepenthes gracilis]|uniref:Uncharacterized protein n=1 Tax=Nepenthes gracilis TaxID=150966 RepID=A0AAD3SY91_NEPGR|nr:hypothetical protein Nepgr_021093 [Nepenthes gracilis]
MWCRFSGRPDDAVHQQLLLLVDILSVFLLVYSGSRYGCGMLQIESSSSFNRDASCAGLLMGQYSFTVMLPSAFAVISFCEIGFLDELPE